jgi:hypothetical protein
VEQLQVQRNGLLLGFGAELVGEALPASVIGA